MIKRLIIALLIIFPMTASAQWIHAFVSSGVTAGQIEGDELKGFDHFGYTGGVGALIALNENRTWGISIEALFTQRGSFNRSYDPYSIRLDLNYIDIPVLLHYQDPCGGMLFGLGLEYGRLVQQPHGNIYYKDDYFVIDTSDMKFLTNDFSIVADARFTIWRGLQLNIRWQHSLIPIKKDWKFKEANGRDQNGDTRWQIWQNDAYNHAITIRLIYQF